MSDQEVELTEEQLKEQKLEAARKKYEELKKAKKGKKKKSKKTKESESEVGGDEDPDKEESVEPTGEVVNSNDTEETVDKINGGELTEDVSEQKINDDTKDVTREDINDDLKDKTKESPNENTTDNAKLYSSLDEQKSSTEEQTQPIETSTDTTLVKSVTEDFGKITVAEKAPSTNDDPIDSLFPSSGPSFLETLQESKVQDEIAELKKLNESLQQQNDSLKSEVKSLKLLKFEHLDEIETLQSKVSDLEAKLSKAKVDSSYSTNQQTHLSAYDDNDDNLSLSPTPSIPQYQQQPFKTNFSQFKLSDRNETSLSVSEIKSRLNKWKNWNVDMTTWRSIGSGPIVEL